MVCIRFSGNMQWWTAPLINFNVNFKSVCVCVCLCSHSPDDFIDLMENDAPLKSDCSAVHTAVTLSREQKFKLLQNENKTNVAVVWDGILKQEDVTSQWFSHHTLKYLLFSAATVPNGDVFSWSQWLSAWRLWRLVAGNMSPGLSTNVRTAKRLYFSATLYTMYCIN